MFKSITLGTFVAANFAAQAFAWNVNPIDVSPRNADGLIVQGKPFSSGVGEESGSRAVIMLHGCSGIYDGDIPQLVPVEDM